MLHWLADIDQVSQCWVLYPRPQIPHMRSVLDVSVVSDSVTPQTVAQQAPLSMDSPGRNTAVGSHSLLQGIRLALG